MKHFNETDLETVKLQAPDRTESLAKGWHRPDCDHQKVNLAGQVVIPCLLMTMREHPGPNMFKKLRHLLVHLHIVMLASMWAREATLGDRKPIGLRRAEIEVSEGPSMNRGLMPQPMIMLIRQHHPSQRIDRAQEAMRALAVAQHSIIIGILGFRYLRQSSTLTTVSPHHGL